MAHELRAPSYSGQESLSDTFRMGQRDSENSLAPLKSATATTDYDAFIGKEESFSSDDPVPPKQKRSRAKTKKTRKVERAPNSNNASTRSLRPALDILSRLKHDPEFSSQSFTIGYIDRHSPEVMEISLKNWKGGEVTDEEFIPQHRIVWFKRDADGKKVWDRKQRLDYIFGSGSAASCGTEHDETHSSEGINHEIDAVVVADRQT